MKVSSIQPKYVERIPKILSDGILYISEKYSTAAHNCCCGCGNKVVTPLKTGRWSLKKSRDQVSISPSIGNWSLACQSHYWIENNSIKWSTKFTDKQIHANRARDKKVLEAAHARRQIEEQQQVKRRRWWERLRDTVKEWL